MTQNYTKLLFIYTIFNDSQLMQGSFLWTQAKGSQLTQGSSVVQSTRKNSRYSSRIQVLLEKLV